VITVERRLEPREKLLWETGRSLNSVPIRKFCGVVVEGRGPYWSLGQHWTWTNKERRWKGLC